MLARVMARNVELMTGSRSTWIRRRRSSTPGPRLTHCHHGQPDPASPGLV